MGGEREHTGQEGRPAPARRHSRRSVVVAAASGLAVAGIGAGVVSGGLPGNPALQRALGVAAPSPAGQLGVSRLDRVYSAARGRHVTFRTILPMRSVPPGMPMCLLLHGLGANARRAAPPGLLRRLASEVARKAVPPFGFVAVDGGNDYWHGHEPGDDPMAMLLEEVPRWLRERGLGGADGTPFACAGFSMGGFGALLYARRRAERRQPPAAVGALAPALITSWREMRKRHAFHDAADWAAMDPLRHVDALRGIPTAVWCGTEDKFIEGVRRFIARARPAIGYTARGRHGDTFNRTVVPSLVGFLGRHVPS